MKRLPHLMNFLGVVALSASLAYWGLQWIAPAPRPLAAAPAAPALDPAAAVTLFGGQPLSAALSNYQLRGVVASGGPDSVAIIAVDGKPARALALNAEVAPGVTLRQVGARFVLLAEGGALRRIELMSAEAARGGVVQTGAVQAGAVQAGAVQAGAVQAGGAPQPPMMAGAPVAGAPVGPGPGEPPR